MKRFALIGYPVSGSLSPALFGAAYGGRFSYDLVETPSFEEAWRRFLATYDGINVTAPFKLDAHAHCDWLSDEARRTGAVNLVLRSGHGLLGYNTDVDGVLGALEETGVSFSDALVVGTGGAARAAAAAAQGMGCRVTVTGRSVQKAAALGFPAVPPGQVSALRPDIILYTLPGNAAVPEGLPLRNAIVLEAEYKRPALAGAPCRAYIGGRRWLLWQAVAGYRLFTGAEPDLAAMEAVFSSLSV